jgi:beta-galactosidase
LLDWASWWALESPGKPTADLQYMRQLRTWYSALHAQGITIDFAHPEADLRQYKLVLAPNLYLVSDAAVANIEQFVSHGGTFVLGNFSGIVNAQNQVRIGGYPAPWRSLLGLRVEEFAPFPADGSTVIATSDEEEIIGSVQVDVIQREGAEALAFFTAEFYAGSAAITRNRFGKGHAYYVAACLDAAGLNWLFTHACATAELSPTATPVHGVEYIRRSNGAQHWLFVLNHNPTPVVVRVPHDAHDLLGAPNQHGSLNLPAFGVAILAQARA